MLSVCSGIDETPHKGAGQPTHRIFERHRPQSRDPNPAQFLDHTPGLGICLAARPSRQGGLDGANAVSLLPQATSYHLYSRPHTDTAHSSAFTG